MTVALIGKVTNVTSPSTHNYCAWDCKKIMNAAMIWLWLFEAGIVSPS